MKPIIPLTEFQRAWVGDHSRYKIAAKARRIGFTFATTLEIALDAVERRTRWLVISRTQDAAKEAIGEIGNHLRAMRKLEAASAPVREQGTGLFFEGIEIHKFVIELPNGSEITAMTAHPDAARGFGGNLFLDEHGFHRDSKELWKGASASVLRGHRLIVVSTPHYQLGNYYDLARKADLVSGRPPLVAQNSRPANSAARKPRLENEPQSLETANKPQSLKPANSALPLPQSIWSAHWVDIHTAAPQLANIGVPIDLEELRELAGDDETWQQEFCCQFLSAAEMWISLELIAAARSPMATRDWNPELGIRESGPNSEFRTPNPDLYFGADIGRKRDRTAIWIDEVVSSVAICRGIILLDRMPFEQQYEVFSNLLRHPRIRRGCMDQSGIGLALVERLQHNFGGKVEGVTFTQEIKENMSVRLRRRMEERLDKIPENAPEAERDFAAIKREATASGALRFDAARNETGHADIYWAKALSDLAFDAPAQHLSEGIIVGTPRAAEWQPMAMAGVEF